MAVLPHGRPPAYFFFLGFLTSFFGLLSFATEILPYGVIITVWEGGSIAATRIAALGRRFGAGHTGHAEAFRAGRTAMAAVRPHHAGRLDRRAEGYDAGVLASSGETGALAGVAAAGIDVFGALSRGWRPEGGSPR